MKELIIRVQESDQPNTHEYDIFLSDDDYIDCNVADGGIIEEQTLEQAIITAAEHARDYIKAKNK